MFTCKDPRHAQGLAMLTAAAEMAQAAKAPSHGL